MSLRDLIQLLGSRPLIPLVCLGIPPVAAWLMGQLHGKGKGGESPWRYLYALLVYLASVPGIFALVLTAYALFFRNENLLDVNILVYFLPIATMAATMLLIKNNVEFDRIPGFDRLSGLMVMIAVSFTIALALQKTRIWIFFGSSIVTLFALALALFALLKWGAHMLSRPRS